MDQLGVNLQTTSHYCAHQNCSFINQALHELNFVCLNVLILPNNWDTGISPNTGAGAGDQVWSCGHQQNFRGLETMLELGTLGPAAAAPGLKWFKMRPHHQQQQHSSRTPTLALSSHLRGVHDERCLLNILADTEEGEEADPAPITAQYCHGLGQSELSITCTPACRGRP